jgi:hypothetical protein
MPRSSSVEITAGGHEHSPRADKTKVALSSVPHVLFAVMSSPLSFRVPFPEAFLQAFGGRIVLRELLGELDRMPPRVRPSGLQVAGALDQFLASGDGRLGELVAEPSSIVAGVEGSEEPRSKLAVVHALSMMGSNFAG